MEKDEKKKQKHDAKNEAMIALDDIHEKYGKLPSTDIEKFAPVYYPIAIVEMNLDEVSFEDFESVQFAVLSLAELGITDYQVIARTLGLSPHYVFKLMRLLNGYGHMDENGITELGKESIHTGKKIVKARVWQKFQVDALNGTLLKVEQAVTEDMLNDRSETRLAVGHLDYLDSMPVEEISSQLTKNNCNSYIRQKAGILNTNVTSINDVRCSEIRYAKCYMMKLRGCDEPVVFAKRYDSSKEDVKDRFSWEPFSVKSHGIRTKYGFEEDIPYSSKAAEGYIAQLYDMMLQRAEKVKLLEEIKYTMDLVYPFCEEGVKIARTDGVVVPTVDVDERAFVKYRSWILNYLIGMYKDGEYLITHERLFGNIISLRTESLLILDTAALLMEKIGKYGKISIVKRFREQFKDYEGEENLIVKIGEELKKL